MLEYGMGAFTQGQRAVVGVVDDDQARGGELTYHRLPDLGIEIGALPENLLVLVAEAGDLFGFLAHQHIDDMGGAEAHAGTIDGSQSLDGGFGAVP